MAFSITSPTSFRLNNQTATSAVTTMVTTQAHDAHPALGHLILLVFEAVMEVVCVSLPGYIIARLGHFDAEKQKFLANLNVMLFTPCLIFTKLAAQLNAEKLIDLGIIPLIFIIQTLVSLGVSRVVAKVFGFGRRASNFVTAMGVFGNSNSLPISLVLSLSQTLRGLHWDKIPGDNDDEVAARGILYLLIFQQLGQLVRWSWGYHILLAPKSKYEEYDDESAEEGRYQDEPQPESEPQPEPQHEGVLIEGLDEPDVDASQGYESEHFEPAGRTPVAGASRASPADSEDEGSSNKPKKSRSTVPDTFPDVRQASSPDSTNNILSFPRIPNGESPSVSDGGPKGHWMRVKTGACRAAAAARDAARRLGASVWCRLPQPLRTVFGFLARATARVYGFLAEFMNPPLWAMLISVTVASVPELQRAFFEEGSFVKNSVTSAVQSSAGVAVPLILVVLGANLARNTESHPDDEHHDPEEERIGKKLLVASLISRMLLPTLIMAPILAFFAKFVPVSILDDPIFVIVCFLLTGAPSALQLAQICQINMVFENVMAKILFQSYVIWILPSTLILVMCALEVVEWAAETN